MTRLVATVSTAGASRYLQQLCKHWSHRFAVDFTADRGTVTLPFGPLTLTATADRLDVAVDLADPAHAARAKEVIATHLDRFAFREAPLPFDWREEP